MCTVCKLARQCLCNMYLAYVLAVGHILRLQKKYRHSSQQLNVLVRDQKLYHVILKNFYPKLVKIDNSESTWFKINSISVQWQADVRVICSGMLHIVSSCCSQFNNSKALGIATTAATYWLKTALNTTKCWTMIQGIEIKTCEILRILNKRASWFILQS